METSNTLRNAWNTYWILRKVRPEPAWARLLISTAIGLTFMFALLLLGSLLRGHLPGVAWLRATMPSNLILCLSVSYTIHAVYRSIELLLPQRALETILSWRDWRAGLFYSTVGTVGACLGGLIGLGAISLLFMPDALSKYVARPGALVSFLLISVLISAINWIWWRLRARRQALKLQATESQLRLLQAQIEPHFLFNTLANVQSLIDYDTPRAKAMLEAFTDYLRGSFSQLRDGDVTLDAELNMAQSYLQLLQIRMMERLTFEIGVAPELRKSVLPPLLLQPLVENAIVHGLEPKVEGGHIRLSAHLNGKCLEISVDDNGLGLDASRRPGRAGQGMALDNLRTRLQTRYGELGGVSLLSLPTGTRAVIRVPFQLPP